MWCKQCGQDVPGIASPDRREFSCPRCRKVLYDGRSPRPSEPVPSGGTDAAVMDNRPEGPAAGVDDGPPIAYDGWELDEQLRHIDRVLSRAKKSGKRRGLAQTQGITRLDSAHAERSGRHGPGSPKSVSTRAQDTQPAESNLPVLIWTSLLLGLMAFACGVALLIWSIIAGREDFWTIGVPVALGGQICLLSGLILQLDRLSNDNRRTAARLHHLDGQLHDLKTTATMLGTSHMSASGAFCSHPAHGAGSELLLSDLKSQIDLLTLRIAQEQRPQA